MSLAKKLQINAGQKVRLVNALKGFSLDAPTTRAASADVVIVFAKNKADLDKRAAPAIEAAREDRLSWIAYPKAGQLDTDLNRDILWKLLGAKGIRPVRQVALDEVWSALRFRPSGEERSSARGELRAIDPTFFPTPADFRAWLKKNHKKESVLWVGYYKKATGKPSVTWKETVDEALCYGWIDGIRRSFDDQAYVIRFTPRKPGSVWSRRNIERVKALKAGERMRKAGLDAYAHKDVHADSGYTVGDRPEAVPKEIIAEFKKRPEAWTFYQSQPPGYRKQTTAWVTSAKRDETRRRRLAMLIDDSANGLRIKQLRRE